MNCDIIIGSSKLTLRINANGCITALETKAGSIPVIDHGILIIADGTEYHTDGLRGNVSQRGSSIDVNFSFPSFDACVKTGVSEMGAIHRQISITSKSQDKMGIHTRTFLDLEILDTNVTFIRHKMWASSLTALFTRSSSGSFLVMFDHPFGHADISGNRIRLYEHTMARLADGATFEDGGLYLASTRLTGSLMSQAPIDELDYAHTNSWQPAVQTKIGKSWWNRGEADLDTGEVEAARELVQSLLPWRKGEVTSCHVPWCENDYEFDISQPEGETAYSRMMELLGDIDCRYTLFTPGGGLPLRRTDGGWMHVMWLGMADLVNEDEWIPETPLPAHTQRLLDLARENNVGVLAYINPAFNCGTVGDRVQRMHEDGSRHWEICYACDEQVDRLTRKLIEFKRAYGLAGYCFDFIGEMQHCYDPNHDHVPGENTQLVGWRGFQRMLQALDEDDPDIIIDGRLCTYRFAPFSSNWLTYPHPFICDEQPNHMTAWPDLSLDRVFANFQRRVAYWGRNRFFLPNYKIPGFMTHQQIRMFRWKHSWDRVGWKYNVLSSIAVSGINNVVNYLPIREEDEYESFTPEDRTWLKHWLNWAENNADMLLNTRNILGEPRPEQLDGSAACADGKGILFLINPNYRPKDVELTIGERIGLTGSNIWEITELNPNPDSSLGFVEQDETISITVPPHQVLILQLTPGDGAPYRYRPQDWLDAEIGPWALDDGSSVAFPYVFKQAPGWQVDTVDVETKPTHWVRFTCDWIPEPTIQVRLDSQRTPLNLEDHERIQPYLDAGRLLMSFMFRFPENVVQASMKVNGERVPVETCYLGSSWRLVEQEYRERNICGLYADLDGRIDFGKTNKLEVEFAHYGPCEWMGAFIENL